MADAASLAVSATLSKLIPMDEEERRSIDSALTRYPGFPRPPIVFVDIFPLFRQPAMLEKVVTALAGACKELIAASPASGAVAIAGLESRGFLHGVPLAMALGMPFVGIRKAGKLPGDLVRCSYSLEYGTATIEVGRDAVAPGTSIILVDDLLATGGTARAAADLMGQLGAPVLGCVVIVELKELGGAALIGKPVRSILQI